MTGNFVFIFRNKSNIKPSLRVFIEKSGFHCRKQGRKWEVREDREKNKTKKRVEGRKTGRKEGNYIRMQIQ